MTSLTGQAENAVFMMIQTVLLILQRRRFRRRNAHPVIVSAQCRRVQGPAITVAITP